MAQSYPKKSNLGKVIISILVLFIIIFSGVGLAVFSYVNRNGNSLGSFFSRNVSSKGNNQIQNAKNTSNSNKSESSFFFADDLGSKSVTQIVENSLPSVLSIRVKTQSGRQGISSEAAGTGYIVSEDGLVVTNRHVVSQYCKTSALNPTTITALGSDQRAYELSVKSIDPIDDIAILQISNDKSGIKPIKFADSTKIKMGGDVIAIGNALGEFRNTVTRGIVSGVDRTLNTQLTDECTGRIISADGLIQTDAAINKGNSGGPLFDSTGSVIGMNTFGSTDAQNIGFAIPSVTILQALNSYKQNSKITRPRLGVVTRALDAALKVQFDWLPVDYGELIYNRDGIAVTPGSSADKSGLKDGDIILEVDGKKLVSDNDNSTPLRREILSKEPDSTVELTVLKTNQIDSKNEAFRYANSPEKVKVQLGSVNFEIGSKGAQ